MVVDRDAFARALLEWFDKSGRHDLPWQINRDPYRIWVSEIMLQQTQVATVIPYFERFIAAFASVSELAAAPLDDVLAAWSGLGYYARGRNLHKAAQRIVSEHNGSLPRHLDALMALPGIGRSTAAAILALAWNEPETILDGNVKRVLSRVHAVDGWAGRTQVLKELWTIAESHTPKDRPAAYTQAIMDLGATLCVRRRPMCEACPVQAVCAARASDRVHELPAPRPRKEKPKREQLVALIFLDDELLLERRPPVGIWGGLLSLPEVPVAQSPVTWARETLGLDTHEAMRPTSVRHGFTHFDLELKPVLMQARRSGRVLDSDRWLWYNPTSPLPGGVAAPIERLIARTCRLRTDEATQRAC